MTETLAKIRPGDYLLFNLHPARKSFTHGDITIFGEELQKFSCDNVAQEMSEFKKMDIRLHYCSYII
jgi:hypothetical protein